MNDYFGTVNKPILTKWHSHIQLIFFGIVWEQLSETKARIYYFQSKFLVQLSATAVEVKSSFFHNEEPKTYFLLSQSPSFHLQQSQFENPLICKLYLTKHNWVNFLKSLTSKIYIYCYTQLQNNNKKITSGLPGIILWSLWLYSFPTSCIRNKNFLDWK